MPSIAFFESRMTIKIKGKMTGKLKTAMRLPLFGALEAIPEIMVKLDASPKEPRNIASRKRGKSRMGLPITKLYTTKPSKERMRSSIVL